MLTAQLMVRATTVVMPVSGTLLDLPALNEPILFTPQVDNWSRAHFRPVSKEAEQLGRLDTERRRRSENLAAVRSKLTTGSTLSARAVEDPFQPADSQPRRMARELAARSQLAALFLTDEIETQLKADALASAEPFPVLESLAAQRLPLAHLQFAAALTGFTINEVRTMAKEVVADGVRVRAGVPKLVVGNFSAPSQMVRINDPRLYQSHEVAVGKDTIISLLSDYIEKARAYWTALETNKLYNSDDIDVLKKSRVIVGAIAAPIAATPLKRVDIDVETVAASLTRLQEDVDMATNIASKAATFMLKGWPPAVGSMGVEEKSVWLAQSAASELGFSAARAQGHFLTYSRLLLWPVFNLVGAEATRQALSFDDYVQLVRSRIVPLAVEFIQHQWEIRFKNVCGGIDCRLGGHEWFRQRQDPPDLDLSRSIQLVNRLQQNPRSLDTILDELRRWRRESENNLARASTSETLSRLLSDLWESAQVQTDLVRAALSEVAAINDLDRAIDAMLNRLGDSWLKPGIPLPTDTRVTALYSSVGEFVESGRPVLTAVDRFRRIARVYLSTGELEALAGLEARTAWKIAINGTSSIMNAVEILALIDRVEPERGQWVLELDVFLALDVAVVVGSVPNAPAFVPYSSRYFGLNEALSQAGLPEAGEAVFKNRTASIELLKRVQ